MRILDSTGDAERKRRLQASTELPRQPTIIWRHIERTWAATYEDDTQCSEAISILLDITGALITRIEHDELPPTAAHIITTLYADLTASYETGTALFAWSNGARDTLCYGINNTTDPTTMRHLYDRIAPPLRKALQR